MLKQIQRSAPAYALTQDEFLAQYGRDDSSKALINFFFKRRIPGSGMIGAGVPLTILGTVGLVGAVHGVKDQSNGLSQQVYDLWLSLLAGVALGAGIALTSVGAGIRTRYSKKRLLLLLDNYFTGTPIPRGIAKNMMFRAFVQYGEWNAEIRKNMKSMGSSRRGARR